MSSFWRKFRGGSGGGTSSTPIQPVRRPSTTSSQGPDSPRDFTQPPPTRLISLQDQQLFMGEFDKERPDPLLVQSQFVKTVNDILYSSATLPYFVQFLQGWGADKYARFWLDSNSFRTVARQYRNVPLEESLLTGDKSCDKDNTSLAGVRSYSDKDHTSLAGVRSYSDKDNASLAGVRFYGDKENPSPVHVNSQDAVDKSLGLRSVTEIVSSTDVKSNDVEKLSNVDNIEGKLGSVGNRQSVVGSGRDKGLILPDLVSNIQHASDVTPLNSPEGPSPSALTFNNTRIPSQNISLGNTTLQSKENNSSRECVNPSAKKIESCREKQWTSKALSVDSDSASLRSSTSESRTSVPPETQRKLLADDALRIFNKYLAKDAEMMVEVEEEEAESLRARISEGNVDSDIFLSLQERIFDTLEKDYLPKFLGSDYFLKHQIDVLTSGTVRLADIIYSDSAFPYFMEYVEQEGGRGVLQVWVAVSNFRQQLTEAAQVTCDQRCSEGDGGQQAQADAMILYDKYFSLQATCPQGFSDAVRFIVEGNICREGGPLPSCFDLPLRVVLHVLERDFLPGYLSSNLHIKYLGELINTVKTSVELLGRKKRSGSESTCSSEQSGSVSSVSGAGMGTHNTLLAMDTRRLRDMADPPSMSMRIDEKQLVDPDSLWRRHNYSRLSCGFINELGRFESEIQLQPDSRSESRLRNKLRRLVMREEDKVREDLAYRVAEMVIRDVTNVTLHQDATPPPPPQS